MNIANKLIDFYKTKDPNIFNISNQSDTEKLFIIVIELLAWLKLQRKREIWIEQGRKIKLNSLRLNFEYPWCNDLKKYVENETEFSQNFCIKGCNLDFKDEISNDYIHEARTIAYENYNPEKIIG